MRSFILAVVTIVLVAVGAQMMLQTLQVPADVAFTTSGARIDPGS